MMFSWGSERGRKSSNVVLFDSLLFLGQQVRIEALEVAKPCWDVAPLPHFFKVGGVQASR